MFYILTGSLAERDVLLDAFKHNGITAYISLHKSPFYQNIHTKTALPNADSFTDTLVQLPFYYELKQDEQDEIIDTVQQFYKNRV